MSEYELERRLAQLEHKVDHLFATLGVAPPPTGQTGLSPRVQELLADGNKIEAIKQYRAETGLGLAEAKEAIEAYGG
jgi:large subunit ribosomal protein L7/L12